MLAPLLLALLPAPTCVGDILTLDDDPGAQFNDLATALAAARSGDTILVADGTYGAAPGVDKLTIAGKGISIISETSVSFVGGPKFEVGLEVRDLPAGERFTMHGITVRNTEEAISVIDCSGTVWLEALFLRSGSMLPEPLEHARLAVERSRSVVLLDSNCTPSSGESTEVAVASCLDVLNSRVFVYESDFLSGTSSSATTRPAVRVRDSQVVTHQGSIRGGTVVPSQGEPCPQFGGVALELDGVGASLAAYGPELAGGLLFPLFGCTGPAGPVLTGTGTLTQTDVPVFRDLSLSRLLTSGTSSTITARGLPGELVSIAVFQPESGLEVPAALGSLFAPASATPVIVGMIGSGGSFLQQFTPPQLPAGTTLRFNAQAALVGVDGLRFSRPAHSVLRSSL